MAQPTPISVSVALTTAAVDIYTTPPGKYLTVTFCQVTNIDGTNSVDVTVTRYSGHFGEFTLASTIPLAADDAISPIVAGFILLQGERLRGWASANGDAVIHFGGFLEDMPA